MNSVQNKTSNNKTTDHNTNVNKTTDNKTTDHKSTDHNTTDHKTTPNKIKTLRCKQCNKKISFIPFICKCNYSFCINHRYPHTHNCSFDNISLKKDKIKKDNPKINIKFDKI